MPTYYAKAQEIFAETLNFTASHLSAFLGFCLKNNYNYNPHQHVKIWLSKDKDVFLTPLNQLRLVQMRAINPTDSIHFVYDSRLLSPKALDALIQFCNKHRIIPHDILHEIIPACRTDLEEKIIKLYEDEISHLHEGGNLGTASDYIRTLSPVYYLGSYTDFDVHIDTRKLPPSIQVNEPILINFNKDSRWFCNDILIVTSPQNALEFIQVIQQGIIDASTPKDASRASTFKWNGNEFYSHECQKKLLEEFISMGYSSRQFRGFIAKIDNHFSDLLIEGKVHTFDEFLELLNAPPANPNATPYDSNIAKLMLREAVMNSTGPYLYGKAIEDYIKFNLFKIIMMYRSCGFLSTYGLNQAFKGQTNDHSNNDMSWTSDGMRLMQTKEEEMDKNAKIIQNFFRKNISSKKDDKTDSSTPKLS